MKLSCAWLSLGMTIGMTIGMSGTGQQNQAGGIRAILPQNAEFAGYSGPVS